MAIKKIWKAERTTKGLQFIDKDGIRELLSSFPEGQRIDVTIEKERKRRSQGDKDELTNFNGYYWAVIIKMIAEEMGESDADYVHQAIQIAVGNFKEIAGLKVPLGTKLMSGGEFSEYCSKCRNWASSFYGIFIPEPHEIAY